MSDKGDRRHWVQINRAPVMTLWAAIVAERLGFRRDEALTLGRAVTGLNAYSKGRSLGLFKASQREVTRQRQRLPHGRSATVELLGRRVRVCNTADGLRAVHQGKPMDPDSVQDYLDEKFAEALGDARAAMQALARAYPPAKLAERAYTLYEDFRPAVPKGKKGWGAAGRLSLDAIRRMTKDAG